MDGKEVTLCDPYPPRVHDLHLQRFRDAAKPFKAEATVEMCPAMVWVQGQGVCVVYHSSLQLALWSGVNERKGHVWT